jgi:hypothetical protein
MPITIILVLATIPVLTLVVMLGSGWSSATLDAAKLALATALAIVVGWLVVDGARALADRWRRFLFRPN